VLLVLLRRKTRTKGKRPQGTFLLDDIFVREQRKREPPVVLLLLLVVLPGTLRS
jgi:hypothetical protein